MGEQYATSEQDGSGQSGRAVRLAAARDLRACRVVKEGVDAGGGRPLSRPDVLTPPPEVLGSLEAGVIAEGVESWPCAELRQRRVVFLLGLLSPRDCLLGVAQANVGQGHVETGDILLGPSLL